jgi:hypothetical protein
MMKGDLIPGLISLAGLVIIISLMFLVTLPPVGIHVLEPISLNVSPTQVTPGETVMVTMEVRNVGKEKGTWELVLLINGVVEQSKLVTLDVGESASTSFFVEKDIEGSYTVRLFRLTETFVVVKPEPSPELGTLTVHFIDVGQGDYQ